MLTLITSAVLLCGGLQDAAAAPATDAKTELVTAAKKMTEAESYKFTSLSESKRLIDGEEGGGFGGRGGGRGGEPREPVPTKGEWMVGQPMHLTVGETQAYKEGEQVVYKDQEGNWKLLEFGRGGRGGFGGAPPAGGEGRGGGGAGRGGEGRGGGDRGGEGRGGDRGGEGGGGERGGAGSGGRPGRAMDRGAFALFGLRGVEAPHTLLADLDGKLADTKKVKDGDSLVYSGALTDAGAEALGGAGRRGFGGRGGGRGGGGGGDMVTTGTYRFEVKEGAVVEAVFAITREGSFGERSFEMTTTRTFTFTDVGKTEYEVPAEALTHFEI